MAVSDHFSRLIAGIEGWNAWRRQDLFQTPDLKRNGHDGSAFDGAILFRANLAGCNLMGTDFPARIGGAQILVEPTSSKQTYAGLF
jgi:hypothetical protein